MSERWIIRVFYAPNPPQTSIIVRMGRRAARRTQTKVCATFLALCSCAFALNPSLDINQYAHTAWTVREGFFKGTITAIAQTPDGYLWLGTESGLLRFDGVRSVPWQPPPSEHLPSGPVRSLLAARDGRLWIGTTEGLASWRDGKLTQYPEVAGQASSAPRGSGWDCVGRRVCGVHWPALCDSEQRNTVLWRGRQFRPRSDLACMRIAMAISGLER